jgi:hypothetical protein
MTTLTIEIPDSATNDISNMIRERGGSVLNIQTDDEDLSANEVEFLKNGLKEALLIKEGQIKSIPFSDLWDE